MTTSRLNDKYIFDAFFGQMTVTEAADVLGVTLTGTTPSDIREIVAQATIQGGGSALIGGVIGPPTDGEFGVINQPDISPTDTVADAMDKLTTSVELLLPDTPNPLNSITLTLTTAIYSAFISGTNTLVTNVQNESNKKPASAITEFFGDAKTGVLSAVIRNTAAPASVQGTVALTSGDDTGFYTYLQITEDSDPYTGSPNQSGFFNALKARIGITNTGVTALTPSNTVEYSFQLVHSTTGSTNVLTFYQDDAHESTPSVTAQSITAVNTAGVPSVSGVPTLSTSSDITTTFTVNNCIGKFYHASATAEVSGSGIVSATALPTGADRNEGTNPTFVITTQPAAGTFTNNLTVTCVARNSAGVTDTDTATFGSGPIRVDTTSLGASGSGFLNESDRKNSGTGQFPAYTGAAYVSTTALTTNEELQLIGGEYQFPPATDYSSQIPSGPDYSSITGGTYNTNRWVTFDLGAVTAITAVTLNLEGTVNFGTDKLISGFDMYVRIDGATGWVDGNAAFTVATPNPSADEDPAYDFGRSTVTSRRITFGTTTRTGNVIVRLGLPSGSNKKLTGVTLTATT